MIALTTLSTHSNRDISNGIADTKNVAMNNAKTFKKREISVRDVMLAISNGVTTGIMISMQ